MAIRDLFSRKQVCHLLVTDEGEIAKNTITSWTFSPRIGPALGIISELEHLYYGSGPFTMAGVELKLSGSSRRPPASLVEALNGLARGKVRELSRVIDRIDQEIAPIFAAEPACRRWGNWCCLWRPWGRRWSRWPAARPPISPSSINFWGRPSRRVSSSRPGHWSSFSRRPAWPGPSRSAWPGSPPIPWRTWKQRARPSGT